MTPIDIRPADLDTVRRILSEHVPTVEVRAFGSRVAWNARETSDLDLALMTDEPLTLSRMADLRAAFTGADVPFRVDIVDWASTSESFRRVVEAEHVVLAADPGACTLPVSSRVMLGSVIDLRLSSVDKKTSVNEHPVRLCNYMDVYHNSFIHGDLDFMEGTATAREISKCTLRVGDVVITKDSERHDDIGVPALVRETVPGLVCGYHLAILRAIPSRIDGTYLFYALSTAHAQRQFHSYANGVTRFGLRKTDIGLIDIPLLPLRKQRTIAHILGTLDDKIELNRRMNATLEAMARALFKSWFVDFDPVRAKMAGRDTGLPNEIADLFPDRLVDSEVGEIPKGWGVGVLDDAVELLNGGTPRTSVERFWNGDIPWYTAKDAPAPRDVFAVETERTITQAGVDNSATIVLPSGTTVISARGSVGRLACLGRPMAMNQTCYGIRGAGGYGDFFTYWLVRGTVEQLRSRTHGTIFDTITRQTFALVHLALPPASVADAFESAVLPIMERILSNLHQSGAIAPLRDTLLPKLASGEVRVTRREPARYG